MNATHTIIGMPDAGKTTFLAALWHIVTSREIQSALVFDRLEGDVNYLNDMVDNWQRCEKVRRTSTAEDHPIVIHLKQHGTSIPVVLNFTDLSGEKFEQQFASRSCEPEYLSEINGGGGLLLFINADRPHKGKTILDAEGLVDSEDEGEPVDWQPSCVSEEAQLVDLLQCLQQRPFEARRRRLAVIVSAWDVVKNRDNAEEWLKVEMPFLFQFLSTNQDCFEVRMYGISAQGGVIETDESGKVVETETRTEMLTGHLAIESSASNTIAPHLTSRCLSAGSLDSPMADTVLEQALFGYDDGHRLLQASSRLSNYERDLLLQLSDLAPGISRLGEDGYWTGMPLREASRYALLRTWPAPEMSRPGCVWTHALLIPFEFLDRAEDLLWITSFFRRPQSNKRLAAYAEPIIVESNHYKDHGTPIPNATELISCVYFSICRPSDDLSQDQLGVQSIALWNQQWSELRSRFNFRTLERKGAGRSWLLNFDMMLSDGALRLQRERPQLSLLSISNEKSVALGLVEDLRQGGASDFREFRDVYGVDLPLHPVWTAFLMSVQVWLKETASLSEEVVYKSFLEEVAISLPERTDGVRLKTALMDFTASSPFELQPKMAVNALAFFFNSQLATSFPPPQFSEDAVRWLWANDRSRFLALMNEARQDRSDFYRELLLKLLAIANTAEIFEGTQAYPRIRKSLVELQPELLLWDGLSNLSGTEIANLLDGISEDQLRELDLVRVLMLTKDSELARFLCERFPDEVVFAVCTYGPSNANKTQPHEMILGFIGGIASRYLTPDFVSRLKTTTGLLGFAAMLGFVNPNTVSAGPQIWANSLRQAVVDSPIHELHKLQAFALALGLATPRPGSEVLLEYSFESIYDAMKDSYLDYQSSVMLEPLLPDVPWWRRWDSCYRLRIAVINAYAYGDLPLHNFTRLAKRQPLMSSLWHELESNDQYRQLLESLRRIA